MRSNTLIFSRKEDMYSYQILRIYISKNKLLGKSHTQKVKGQNNILKVEGEIVTGLVKLFNQFCSITKTTSMTIDAKKLHLIEEEEFIDIEEQKNRYLIFYLFASYKNKFLLNII